MNDNLFASKTKSKLLSFFILNPERYYSFEEIRKQVSARNLKEDLSFLIKHDFLLQVSRKGTRYYSLNAKAFLDPKLRAELSKKGKKFQDLLAKEIKKLRGFELGIFSGILKGYGRLQCDLLLVGSFTQKTLAGMEKRVQQLIGEDLLYAALTKEEYEYRKNVFDRFLKDIFDHEHTLVYKDKKK